MSRALAAALLVTLAGAAAPVAAPSCADYRVVRGDTLTHIARRCHSSIAAIARASGIRNPNLILVGQRLVIPGRGRRSRATTASRRPAPTPGRCAARLPHGARRHDLFARPLVAHGLPALLAANPGIDPRQIEIGDAVRLPAGAVRPERARTRERGAAAAPPPRREPGAVLRRRSRRKGRFASGSGSPTWRRCSSV